MSLIQLHPSAITLGDPVPVPLRDASGRLLLARGSVIDTDLMRQQLLSRGLYVDEAEAASFAPAMAGKLHEMLQQTVLLSEIAQALSGERLRVSEVRGPTELLSAWADLVLRASRLLCQEPRADFLVELTLLEADLHMLVDRHADAALLYLVHQVISNPQDYSAKHSLLVAAVCDLASRHLAHWPDGCRSSLRCAAITMNIAMTKLQDELATQHLAPTMHQRDLIKTHAQRGAAMLVAAGVTDPLWLDAVALHHDTQSGVLAAMSPSTQLARLLQRADIFTARLSPREGRRALSAKAAAQSAYLDERERADQAGEAIVKAAGLYPPGTHVRLADGEVAMVLRRGRRADQPLVVSLPRDGEVVQAEPQLRDTRMATFSVTTSVPPHEVGASIALEQLFQLLGD